MPLKFSRESIPEIIMIEPDVFNDERGFFMEFYHSDRYNEIGIKKPFLQDNHSHSKKGVLRGLHYQLKNPQEKLVYVIRGEIYDVAVDIRFGSPTFGQWAGALLSDKNRRQLFIPEGFAHGFCVLSETSDVIYKCTDIYTPGDEYGILWSDSEVDITWPIKKPIYSDKDGKNPKLNEINRKHLPVYQKTVISG